MNNRFAGGREKEREIDCRALASWLKKMKQYFECYSKWFLPVWSSLKWSLVQELAAHLLSSHWTGRYTLLNNFLRLERLNEETEKVSEWLTVIFFLSNDLVWIFLENQITRTISKEIWVPVSHVPFLLHACLSLLFFTFTARKTREFSLGGHWNSLAWSQFHASLFMRTWHQSAMYHLCGLFFIITLFVSVFKTSRIQHVWNLSVSYWFPRPSFLCAYNIIKWMCLL